MLIISSKSDKPKHYHYAKITSEFIIMSNSEDRLSPKSIVSTDVFANYNSQTVSFMYGRPENSLVIGCCKHKDGILLVARGGKVNEILFAEDLILKPGLIIPSSSHKLLSIERDWFTSKLIERLWLFNNYKVVYNNPMVCALSELLLSPNETHISRV